ncbi:hypothetical protein [Thalassovita mangrovi]|uniref:Uncharacterized protein n=1 Tax=Thalassovita mangrovi TaxID=2692236 RepID=A0A6L8LN47_9RHOB|nr:hypothetical protein [Thalassovita mangrovi]MYM57461.1 hypothetical protein [Thalassovita mangrovi]
MLGPFSFWSPTFRFPLSGDVTQDIDPEIQIAGVPEIEARVVREVASYGAQLGKVLEALQALGAATGTELGEIDALVGQVEAVKADSRDAIRARAEAALKRLREVDEDGWREVVGK